MLMTLLSYEYGCSDLEMRYRARQTMRFRLLVPDAVAYQRWIREATSADLIAAIG